MYNSTTRTVFLILIICVGIIIMYSLFKGVKLYHSIYKIRKQNQTKIYERTVNPAIPKKYKNDLRSNKISTDSKKYSSMEISKSKNSGSKKSAA